MPRRWALGVLPLVILFAIAGAVWLVVARRPVPTVAGLYGPAIAMDSHNNTRIGGPFDTATSYRFRATATSDLEAIRIYVVGPDHEGYGAGTGGTWEISVQTDDGTTEHVPSGVTLATSTYLPVSGLPRIAWSSPARLTSGVLYHVVFRNVDPDPRRNYASVNGVFTFEPSVPRQPRFSDTNWGQPLQYGDGSWSDRPDTVPIMQLEYADGTVDGLGYMEVWVRSHRPISGNAMAREEFTVSGANRIVTGVQVRLMRVGGFSPLIVRLETARGDVVEESAIPAAGVAAGSPGSARPNWVETLFSEAHVLLSEETYRLTLSTAADTTYSIFVIRKGLDYGFGPTTFFGDGHAQHTTGSGWAPFVQDGAGALDQADLQFFFR